MGEKPVILLVDDRDENLYALEAVLQENGADLLKARSGVEALELLLVHEVALALVDVQMPEMDGFELAELMRGTERTRDIPLIFITAGQHDRTRIFKGYQSGAVDFLHKPLDPHVLRSKVGVFLQLDRQKRQLAQQVRELKEAEERLREADRRKNQFLAVLSHELRNPLAPIKNSLYILERVPPGGDQAQRAQAIIHRQVGQLARLVDDLLDVTRISRNKFDLKRQRLELNELVCRTVEDYRSLFAQSAVHLQTELASAEIFLNADWARLAQVIGNILHNAVKFTPPGGSATVSVAYTPSDKEALIRVVDTGAGMPPEIIARLFEPFAQADRTLDRSQGGLGLGLALVKAVVEMHGGSVSAHSAGPGKGAEFIVRLPCEQGTVADRPVVSTSSSRTQRRILIIEDNIDAADSLREVLELGGHEVTVATTGLEGIDKARSFRPDVVLCDLGLPGLDGYEVARRMRADPALRSIRLIALSGYALPEDRERSKQAGFTDHLAKPPSLELLQEQLEDAAMQ